MKGPNRAREVTDMPAIRLTDGRHIPGVCRHTWRKKWNEVYRFIVLHWETTKGIVINLESLVAAVYPETQKNTFARTAISHDFMWNLIAERRQSRTIFLIITPPLLTKAQ